MKFWPGSSSEQAFWRWFLKHEDALLTQELNREHVFNLLNAELHKIDPHLTFEFGPPAPKRDFILSADGIKDSFPAVLRIQKACPNLANWNLIAFRQRCWPLFNIRIGKLEIRPEEVFFTLLSSDRNIGLRLFIPGYKDELSSMKTFAYLFLDEALGEFDVETKVGLLKFLPADDPVDGERYSLAELPERFDKLYAELNGLTGKPS